MSKDNFSKQANIYAKYRPQYPAELFEFIFSRVNTFDCAIDMATGNGQAAIILAKKFNTILANDLSQKQIDSAVSTNNIEYSVQKAENTTYPNHCADLITVAQALHWFDFTKFFTEVTRLLKPQGTFVAWCYGLNSVNKEVDEITKDFYTNIVGPFWDAERKHIENNYRSIPFPWKMEEKQFFYNVNWTLEEYLGYLSSWSSVQHYKNKMGSDPILDIEKKLKIVWINKALKVTFPIHLNLVCL